MASLFVGLGSTEAESRLHQNPESKAGLGISTRIFELPTARVVGAFNLALSYDGSLLEEPGILSSTGILAIGFGDIAQLEYRTTSAITSSGRTAPLPSVGAQMVLPLPRRNWPTLAFALRLGIPRAQNVEGLRISEKATDGYLVSEHDLHPRGIPLRLHAGLRVTRATLNIEGQGPVEVSKTLVLPALGIEWMTGNHNAVLASEITLAPRFSVAGGPSIDRALQGRVGVRWALVPWLTLDTSLGYRVLTEVSDDRSSLFRWDIRLGAEMRIPWDRLACRGLSILCKEK